MVAGIDQYSIFSAKAKAKAKLRLLELSGEDFSGLKKYARDPIGFITEFLGETLTDEQKQIAIAVLNQQEVNVQAAHGVGKCVAASDVITLFNGREVKAYELIDHQFTLPVLVDGEVREAVALAEHNAFEVVYEVITESGRRIKRNGAHPLYAGAAYGELVKELGWTKVDELTNGQAIAVTETLPLYGDRSLEAQDLKVVTTAKYMRLRLPTDAGSLSRAALRIFLSKLFSSYRWGEDHPSDGVRVVMPCESREDSEALQRLLLRFGVWSSVAIHDDEDVWVNIIQGSQPLEAFAREIDIAGHTGVIELAFKAIELRSQFLSCDDRELIDRRTNAPAGTYWERIVSIREMDKEQTVAISVPGIQTYLTSFYEHNSHLGSRLILWGVFCLRGMAISTAPTERQVKEILWKYVRSCYDENEDRFGGSRGELFVKLTEDARAFGFTARHTSSDGFQGIHAERMLLIEDEASGISEQIDDGAMSCITGAQNTLLRIGNPVSVGTPFQKACRVAHIRIPVWGHPNVSWAYELHDDGIHRLKPDIAAVLITNPDEGTVLEQSEWPERYPRDKFPGAVSIQWIEKVRAKKGEGSAFWESRVEGRFPQDSPFAAIPRRLLIEARARYDLNKEYWDRLSELKPAKRWGLDVGDGGDDHGLAYWDGPVWRAVDLMAGQADHLDTKRAATWAAKEVRSHFPDTPRPYATIMVDNIGVGAGTLADLKTDYFNAVPSGWGDAPRDKHGRKRPKATRKKTANDAEGETFKNEKARQFWALREALIAKEIAIAPLGQYEDKVFDELSLIFYEETPKGEIKIEPKKKSKERIGYSPNMADAAVEGFNAPKHNTTPLKGSTPQQGSVHGWMADLGL